MAHPLKGVGSFVIVIVLAYLAIRYWASIKAAIAPAQGGPSANVPGTQPGNLARGGSGAPNYTTGFGGSANPNLNLVPADPGGIKSVGGDVNDQRFVGPDVLGFFASLGGIDFGNPNPQGGTGGPIGGGPEHFI